MKKRIAAFLLALVMILGTVATAVAVTVEVPPSKQKIKEVVYYDKTPDPNVNEEMKNYPAVWMLYEDPENKTNIEVFTLKPVETEEEAENKNFGMKGMKVDGKWYKVVAIWTVDPDHDIIDKENGEKAVFTPLYYSEGDKPQEGDKLSVALYDNSSGEISNLVEVEIPGEGEQTHVVVDDKVIAPPQEVVLTYNGQPQACPYTDTDGYTVTMNDPETDKGIYTAVLILKDGWKWTDGTTAAKPAIWAINPATLTAVTLVSNQLAYTGEERYPEIASVSAGSLTVPAGSYTVSYSEKSIYSGSYTVTVKGKGNFTGNASAEYIIYTVEADTCIHSEYEHAYKDNKDGKTHTEFCTHCGASLHNNLPHNIITQSVIVDGVYCYVELCTLCEYVTEPAECNHIGFEEGKNNGDGTHNITCTRCKKVLVTNERHIELTEPIKTNIGGIEVYAGQYVISCGKCDFREEHTCDHAGYDRVDYVPIDTTDSCETHAPHCAFCKALVESETAPCISDGNWERIGFVSHFSHCTLCGQEIKEPHDFKGTRRITKVDVIPYAGGLFNMFTRYNYRVHYSETCKVCGAVRTGEFPYEQVSAEKWGDYRKAFEILTELNPDELQSIADNVLGSGKYYLLIPAQLLSALYEATGTNTLDYSVLNYDILMNYNHDPDQEGSCKMFDKDGKEVMSYQPDDDDKSRQTRDGEDEEEGVLETDFYRFDFTNADGAALAVSTDYLMALDDGEHSVTACFTTGDGQQVACTILFEIETATGGEKRIKNVHPAGTMLNADGDVVTMNLSATELAYTGEPIEPPAVVLTNEMGVEYAEDEDYTLTWYRVVGLNGEEMEVEVDPENIVEIGNYTVVATPTRNGVLFGEAYACFEVTDKQAVTFICDDIVGLDTYVTENGERLYPVKVRVENLPDGTLGINAAQIFLQYDHRLLELRRSEGLVEWTLSNDGTMLSAVWASDAEVTVKDGDALLTLYFAAEAAVPELYSEITFTQGALGESSSLSYLEDGVTTDLAVNTVDGGIRLEAPAYGDANGDGMITAADAALVLRSLVGLSELTMRGAANADVDGDGTVTAADAAAILRYVVGMIDVFPAQVR